MADAAAVDFLLGNLQQLVQHHSNLIKGADGEIEKLERDLRLFQAILKKSAARRLDDDPLREVVGQIRDVVYDADDIIDAYVTKAAVTKSRNCIFRAFSKPLHLHNIAKRVQPIVEQIKGITGDRGTLEWATDNIGNDVPTKKPERPLNVKRDNIVGFNDESDKIIEYLLEETDYVDVISIIGMPGLGKTTLAGKVFHDKTIQSQFPTRIWLYISQEFSVKEVFLAILKEITDKEMQESTDVHVLVQEIKTCLEEKKFLIVMDDVWKPGDWEEIQNALPMTTHHAGKVLITSRHEAVSNVVNRGRPLDKLHVLRPKLLSDEDSWLLLQYGVFGKPECPIELQGYGEEIVRNCHGLPLAIAVIAGMLVENVSTSSEMTAQKGHWEKVSKSVSTHLYDVDREKRMEKIIALSYEALPYPLRACFLYLGMFPEDCEIPVWKLIRMWIAEGFIEQTKKNDLSLEEVAEIYLDDLIHRNLVKADKTSTSNGRVKICRIHDMLREFCINEAASVNQNFFHEIKSADQGHKCRRICTHSNITSSITSLGHPVRSFLCFSKEWIFGQSEEFTSPIPITLKLLRVLEVYPFYFRKIPKEMYQLLHLRYLFIINDGVIPAALSKLWNLETFIVHTSTLTLEIKADIWKLRQLRHLKTNRPMILAKARKSSNGEGEKLQTLGRISAESFKEHFVNRARNLKKLSVCGKDVISLLDGEAASFNNLAKLDGLEKLKLWHYYRYPCPRGQLPPANEFPPKLKRLTLLGTNLHWDRDINILCLLENLEVLKLGDFAFGGSRWEAKDGVFRCLEVLHIGYSDLRVWKASGHNYPKLRHLRLRGCLQLEEVPISLADIPTFRVLELNTCTHAAVESAKEIEEAKKEKLGEQNVKDGAFNLSIHSQRK